MTRATHIIDIIAEELKLPQDTHLNEIFAYLYLIDKDGEIMKLLVEAGVQDLVEAWKAEGIA